jgi:hypothetical protein
MRFVKKPHSPQKRIRDEASKRNLTKWLKNPFYSFDLDDS